MNQKKNIDINIKKSTLRTISKYILVVVICFIIAIIYPFLNIYLGKFYAEYNKYTNQHETNLYSLDKVYLNPFFHDNNLWLVYSENSKSYSYYYDILPTNQYNLVVREEVDKRANETADLFKRHTSAIIAIKLIFKIEDYAKMFYYTFFALLILSIVVMNFKVKLKLKNE